MASTFAIAAPMEARSARHLSSRPGADGEFRARACRAASQIELGGLDAVPGGALTLPSALTTGLGAGAGGGAALGAGGGGPQMRPTASSQTPDRPLMPTATSPEGQYCGGASVDRF